MFNDNAFWQINIWGIIATILGLIALILSIISLQRSKSKIVINKLDLIIKNPNQITEWYKGKKKEQMKDHVLDFNLKIEVENVGNATGYIEKPILIITLHSNNIKILPFRNNAEPIDMIHSEVWKNELKSQQIAWELKSGQIIKDEIKYIIDDVEELEFIANNYKSLKYSIEYKENSGKLKNLGINSVIVEN